MDLITLQTETSKAELVTVNADLGEEKHVGCLELHPGWSFGLWFDLCWNIKCSKTVDLIRNTGWNSGLVNNERENVNKPGKAWIWKTKQKNTIRCFYCKLFWCCTVTCSVQGTSSSEQLDYAQCNIREKWFHPLTVWSNNTAEEESVKVHRWVQRSTEQEMKSFQSWALLNKWEDLITCM